MTIECWLEELWQHININIQETTEMITPDLVSDLLLSRRDQTSVRRPRSDMLTLFLLLDLFTKR